MAPRLRWRGRSTSSAPRQRGLVATGLATAGLLLVACGGSDADDPEAAGGDGDREITIWKFGSPPVERDYFATKTEEFSDSSRIDVDVEFTDWQTRSQIVAQANASDELPDVMVLENSMLPDLVGEGVIRPLSDLDAPIDEWSKDYVPAFWDLGTYEGEVYGFSPYVDLHTVLLYNHEILNEAGVQPPNDWDSLLTAAETLTTDDRFGIAFAQGGNLLDVDVVEGLVFRNGGRYFDGAPTAENLRVKDPAWEQSLDLVASLAEYAPPGITEMTYRDALQLLYQEQAAMVLAKSFAPIIQDDQGVPPDFPVTMTKLPAPETIAGPAESATFVAQAPFLFLVTRQADDLEAVREYFDYWAQPEVHQAWWDGTIIGRIPATTEGLDSEGFATTYPQFAQEWADGNLFEHVEPIPAFPGRIDSQTFFAEQLQRLLLGDASSAEVLTALDENVRQGLQ